ncbi:Peptidase S8/S53 subtilisin kexin sedolisin [Thauera humireducens]|jgi:subtilisin family serine protease|uniref:subtilisin-like serine protease QhpE n=1 Tax=Thauera humireducens TaxID=1134435 RepID=UPI002467A276|nr:S8 family serine peptidase [Thauera humireducens]CAH1745968.1 Peptidase S8/S53 subtilisin kexin sedolisin [Thauera humireducens]
MALRVAVVDSGCSAVHAPRVRAAAAFVIGDGGLDEVPVIEDVLGHGSRVADILLHGAPQAELLVAQVFRERLTTTAAQVAAAIDWAVANGAQLVNLSLGLREPRPALAEACARAVAAGVVLCAAAPARGQAVYPAAFAGVLRVSGDARCAPGELAAIGSAEIDFGAHVRPLGGSLTGAGASMACAWLSGLAAQYLASGGGVETLRDWLEEKACHRGVDDPRRRQHGE